MHSVLLKILNPCCRWDGNGFRVVNRFSSLVCLGEGWRLSLVIVIDTR